MLRRLTFYFLLLVLAVPAAHAQVKIGDGTVSGDPTTPNSNAILDLSSARRGVLFPRVALTATAQAAPLTAHVAGMMVYNITTAGDVVPAIYYNDGTKWVFVGGVKGSGITYDPDTYIISYTDADGNPKTINLVEAIKDNETKTLLIKQAEGKYVYYNEEAIDATGAPIVAKGVIIDVPADVVSNFEQIINEDNVKNEILNLIKNVGGNVYYDGTQFTYVDQAGDTQVVNIEQIVKANETVTTLVKNNNGTYTYTSEDGTVTIIDIPASVVENFETIVNKGPVTVNGDTFNTVEEYIKHIANSSVALGGSDFITVTGDGTASSPYVVSVKEGAANSMLITNEAGELEWATIESIVKLNETETTLVKNNDGTYTYTNEKNKTSVIDIPAEVINNFEKIVKEEVTVDGRTFPTVEEYITYLTESKGGFTKIVYDQTTGDAIFQEWNETTKEWVNVDNSKFNTIVKGNETVTNLVENTDGTFTYYNESDYAADGSLKPGATGTRIDPSLVNVTKQGNTYVFTDNSGATIAEINFNAGDIVYNDQTTQLGATNVQEAIEKLLTKIETLENTKGDLVVAEGLEFTGGTNGTGKLLANANIGIAEGGITTDKLADNAVTTDKIANETVTAEKLTAGAGTDGRVGIADVTGKVTYQSLQTVVQANQKTVTVVDGSNTTVTNTVVDNNTEYKVNVATAKGADGTTAANLGVVKEAATNPTVLVSQAGELSVNLENLNAVKVIDDNYAVDLADGILLANAANDITITLPTASGNKGKRFIIKKEDNSEDTYVTVEGSIAGVVGGELYTAVPYTGWELVSDGTAWRIINKF